MKYSVLAFALLAAGCAGPPPLLESHGPARELAGLTPGPPRRCVSLIPTESLRPSENDRQTLLYGFGRMLWANHLAPGCGFGYDDVLVTEPLGDQLCQGDIVRSFDRTSRIPGPSCVLSAFVPYRR